MLKPFQARETVGEKVLRYRGMRFTERDVSAFRRLMCVWRGCVHKRVFIKNREMGDIGEN